MKSSVANAVIVSALRELLGTAGKTPAQVFSLISESSEAPTPESKAVVGLFLGGRGEGYNVDESSIAATLVRLVGKMDTAGGSISRDGLKFSYVEPV